mmetsp:Transcript_6375/g.18919  ORF Transcript_6375/g.18919 Transcript_6375/m.18919 type:complete len:282 (-) Transcript_6375:198-1043(-)
MYRLHQRALADPSLAVHNRDGSLCRLHGDPTFPQPADGMMIWDVANPATRRLLSAACANASSPAGGGFNGCFLDSAATWSAKQGKATRVCDLAPTEVQALTAGGTALLLEMQTTVGPVRLIVAKDGAGYYNDSKYVNTVFMSDTYCSCYNCPTWGPTEAATCEGQIEAAISIGKRSQVVFMHGEANRLASPPVPDAHVFTFSLAAFLIAAYDNSFFGYSEGWYYNGSTWHREYDLALGAPKGDALRVGRSDGAPGATYTRHFEHATVTLDVAGYNASIQWA